MHPIPPTPGRLALRYAGGGWTVIDRRWRYDLRSPFWRIYRNRDAGAWIEHPGGMLRLAPGAIILLPAWGRFRSGCTGQVRHLYLHVAVDGLDGGWHDGLLERPQTLAADPALAALADRCEEPDGTAWAGPLMHAAFAAWRTALPRLLRQRLDLADAELDPLRPALDLVEQQLGHALPTPALARAAGMSVDTLARTMRRRLGCTPALWIRRRRCARAAGLLAHGDGDIAAVAAACGFADRHHFTKVFAQVMGSPPATWRDQARLWTG